MSEKFWLFFQDTWTWDVKGVGTEKRGREGVEQIFENAVMNTVREREKFRGERERER